MLKTDMPSLTPAEYGRASELIRELTAFVTYAEMHPTSAAAFNVWFTSANTVVAAALTAADPTA